MQGIFKVAIHYDNDCGYVEYDQANKTVKVVLDHTAKRQEVENYLATEHVIRVAGKQLLDFADATIRPVDNVDNLQTALTRMWEKIGVYVDWSRPVA